MAKLHRNNLSKIILWILLLSAFSCSDKGKYPLVNSELICPNDFRILVKFTRKEELKKAIYDAYLHKKTNKATANYTVIKLKDGRTLAFKRIPPEVAVNCLIQESFLGFADRRYVHH